MKLAGGTLLLLLVGSLGPPRVEAQAWAADVYAGGTRYDALASRTGAANVIGNLRYRTTRLSAYLSAAVPLERDAPVWSAIGAAGRPSIGLASSLRLGVDLATDVYAFRYDAGVTGSGLSTHVLPVLSLVADDALVELRGGRHDHVFRSDDEDRERYLYEVAARGSIGSTERYAMVDLRSLHGSDQHFPTARVQVGAAVGRVDVWATAGRWFGDDLAETIWGAGAGVDIGRSGELWASVQRDASDPLYLNVARTTWNVGYSVRLGGADEPLAPPLVRDGSIVLRLPLDDGGPPSVAGEFSEWEPLPMRANGAHWVIEIPVRPGVYRFAFVSPLGDWFVPQDYPGRMSDDMGGHVAVVVVP